MRFLPRVMVLGLTVHCKNEGGSCEKERRKSEICWRKKIHAGSRPVTLRLARAWTLRRRGRSIGRGSLGFKLPDGAGIFVLPEQHKDIWFPESSFQKGNKALSTAEGC